MVDDTSGRPDRRSRRRRSEDGGLNRLYQEVGELKSGQRALMKRMDDFISSSQDDRTKIRRNQHQTNNELQRVVSEVHMLNQRRDLWRKIWQRTSAGVLAVSAATIIGVATGAGEWIVGLFTKHPTGGH